MVDIRILDNKYCSMDNGELLLLTSIKDISNEGNDWIFKYIIVDALKNNKKVLCLLSFFYVPYFIDVLKKIDTVNLNNLTIVRSEEESPSQFDIDDTKEIIKEYGDYDLVVVDGLEELDDLVSYGDEHPHKTINKIKELAKDINRPLIVNCNSADYDYDDDEKKDGIEQKFLNYSITNANYIMFVNDDGDIYEEERVVNIYVKFFDQNMKEDAHDYLIDEDAYLFKENIGKINELYNNALALGFKKNEAANCALNYDDSKDDDAWNL